MANIAVFVAESGIGERARAVRALAARSHFAVWQILTYGFLHGSAGHVFFNMFAVYMFGSTMERVWGSPRYAAYYLVCVASAGITQLVVNALTGSGAPTVGASGGVFGLLLAFALYFPRQRLVLLFLPIPMPAWLFVTLYGAIRFFGVTGTQAGVAHFATRHMRASLARRWRQRPPSPYAGATTGVPERSARR